MKKQSLRAVADSWPLENGDRLDQPTFHDRYEATGEHVHAELIGGIVHMPSPARVPHSRLHSRVHGWLIHYQDATPGVEALIGPTAILGAWSEPEPDIVLLVQPEHGGQTGVESEYLVGSPELMVEIAYSSASYDLGQKKQDYEQAGAREYLVFTVRDSHAHWFERTESGFKAIEPDEHGILRSGFFPGLWLDPTALFAGDMPTVYRVLHEGLATPEHADWRGAISRD